MWAGQHQVLVFRNDKPAAFVAFQLLRSTIDPRYSMPAETDVSAGSISSASMGSPCAVTLVERNPEVLTKVAAELPRPNLSTEPGKGERDIAVEVQVQERRNIRKSKEAECSRSRRRLKPPCKEVTSFQRVLQGARDRDVNETDTVTIIKDVLVHVFGFDKYTELTSEQCIRGTYCDLAVKVNNKVQYLIEVKAIGKDLKDNHIRQAVGYGASEGIPWVVLTNGITWEIYRIKFEQPVSHELACTFDLLAMNPQDQEQQYQLFLLCREGLNKAAIDEFYERQQNINRFVIGAILQSKPVLDAIRKEMKRLAPGNKVSIEEIEKILLAEVIKRDVIEGDEAVKVQCRIKKCAAKKKRATKEVALAPVETEAPAEPKQLTGRTGE